MNNELVQINQAKTALAEACDFYEILDIRDKAMAMSAYAGAQGASDAANLAKEVQLRAERKAGEFLRDMPKAQGARPPDAGYHCGSPSLGDMGISHNQSSRWQLSSELPEEDFEQIIAKTKASDGELTSRSIQVAAKKHKRISESEHLENNPLPIPDGRYQTIIVDPPWDIQKIEREVAPNQFAFEYPTMTLDAIKEFDVPGSIAADDCHLFMWTTQKYLPGAFEVLEAWGFKYILTMVWHKAGGFQPYNLPQYNCEFILYGRRGNPQFLETKSFFTCFAGLRQGHSVKPDEFYDLIRRVCPEPRIDLFARDKKDGYEAWGSEA